MGDISVNDYLKWLECFVPEELGMIRHGEFPWPISEECRQSLFQLKIVIKRFNQFCNSVEITIMSFFAPGLTPDLFDRV